MMLKSLLLATAAALAAIALPAAAQSTLGPTPNEQLGMHTGTTVTNGSAVIVTDRTGTHPDGYTGMDTRNHATGGDSVQAGRHHHHHGPLSNEPAY